MNDALYIFKIHQCSLATTSCYTCFWLNVTYNPCNNSKVFEFPVGVRTHPMSSRDGRSTRPLSPTLSQPEQSVTSSVTTRQSKVMWPSTSPKLALQSTFALTFTTPEYKVWSIPSHTEREGGREGGREREMAGLVGLGADRHGVCVGGGGEVEWLILFYKGSWVDTESHYWSNIPSASEQRQTDRQTDRQRQDKTRLFYCQASGPLQQEWTFRQFEFSWIQWRT